MADKNKKESEKTVIVAKNVAELQKIRLERLMSNPTKPVHIPEKSKDYKPREPLEFVRNIWGSSAGAGSGDFHVYRGVRRREYARQKFRKEKEEKEDANETYRTKVESNQKVAEERTAKKRAKRLKKKQKQKNKKPRKEEKEPSDDEDDDEDENEEENDVCSDERKENTGGCETELDKDNDEKTSEKDVDTEKGGSGSEQSGSNEDR